MKVSQLKAGVILTYLSQGINILVGLAYTPIMLRLLGQNEYGLYQLVASIVAYLSLLSLGFGSSYVRFYSRYKAKEEKREIARLNGMFMTIFLFISLITLIVGAIMVINIEWIFGTGLTNKEYEKAKILMSILVLNMALTFPNSIFNSYITAHEKFIFQKLLSVAQSIMNPFLALPLLILGYGSVALVLVSTFITIAKLLLDMWYSFKRINMQFLFRGFKFSLLKELWTFTFFVFLTQIINQINWNVDKFLLGRFSGTASVAIFAVANTIRMLYVNLSSAVSSVFIPRVNKMVAELKDDMELTRLMTRIGRLQLVILLLILSGFTFFGQSFVQLWAGVSYHDSFWVAVLIMIPGTIPLIQNIGIEIQFAKNLHKFRSILYSIIAMGNIIISIPLIKMYGPIGAAIGTAISLIIGNGLFMNIYYHFRVGLNMKYYWKEILKLIPPFIPNILIGTFINYFWDLDSWIMLAIFIVFYTVIYVLFMWIFGLNRSEKDLFIKPYKRLMRKFT